MSFFHESRAFKNGLSFDKKTLHRIKRLRIICTHNFVHMINYGAV